jgi:hypothetical protein
MKRRPTRPLAHDFIALFPSSLDEFRGNVLTWNKRALHMHLRLRFPAFRGPSIGTSMRNLSCVFALMLAAALPARTMDNNLSIPQEAYL